MSDVIRNLPFIAALLAPRGIIPGLDGWRRRRVLRAL